MSKPILTIYEEQLAPVKFRQRKLKVFDEQEDKRIALDPRQDEEEYLDSLLREMCHFLDPEAGEDVIRQRTAVLSFTLWAMGYRRVRL